MIKNWNNYNDINNDITLKYDDFLIQEININNNNNNNNDIIKLEEQKIDINNIDLEIPKVMNTKYIKKNLNNIVVIIEYLLDNLIINNDNLIYFNYIKEIFLLLDNIFNYKIIINDNNILRSSYNFCNKYPICFDYYNNLIKTKYKRKCNFDHITLNKLYKDYISLYQYIINNKNIDIENIRKSLNTILFVLKENIKIINNIIDIIKNKKIELQENVTLYNFLSTF